jgi:5-hydroxyisourate hydrolase-like protein (transthyretin family)
MLGNRTLLLTLVLLAIFPGASTVPAPVEVCTVSELTVAAVRGQVIFTHRGEKKPGANAEVELKVSRDDEWHTMFKVAADAEGRFVFPEVKPGEYLLEARSHGYESTGAHVRVKRGSSKRREIVVPLRMPLEGCVYASVRKRV